MNQDGMQSWVTSGSLAPEGPACFLLMSCYSLPCNRRQSMLFLQSHEGEGKRQGGALGEATEAEEASATYAMLCQLEA